AGRLRARGDPACGGRGVARAAADVRGCSGGGKAGWLGGRGAAVPGAYYAGTRSKQGRKEDDCATAALGGAAEAECALGGRGVSAVRESAVAEWVEVCGAGAVCAERESGRLIGSGC